MKTIRAFLEDPKHSDSYIRTSFDKETSEVSMKVTDCDRRIWWYFGRKGEKRAIAKITKVKKIVDEVYAYLMDAK